MEGFDGPSDRPQVESDSDDEPLGAGQSAQEIAASRHEARIEKRAEEEAIMNEAAEELKMSYEGLGEDFEDTPWVPPTIKNAFKHKVREYGLCLEGYISVL